MNTLMMSALTGNNYIKTVCDYNTLFCRPARLRGSDYFFSHYPELPASLRYAETGRELALG